MDNSPAMRNEIAAQTARNRIAALVITVLTMVVLVGSAAGVVLWKQAQTIKNNQATVAALLKQSDRQAKERRDDLAALVLANNKATREALKHHDDSVKDYLARVLHLTAQQAESASGPSGPNPAPRTAPSAAPRASTAPGKPKPHPKPSPTATCRVGAPGAGCVIK